MSTKTKLALKAIEMNDKIVISPAVVSPLNMWTSMHWHDFYELEIVLSGSGEIIFNNKNYTIIPGMISFLTPADMHKYSVKSDIHIICIQFTEDSISKDILESLFYLKNNVIYADEEQLKRVVTLCDLLSTNTIGGKTGALYASKLLETLLVSLKNEFGTETNNYKSSPLSMQKALVYINAHFKENPKMSDVAKMLFLNEHYFCTLFKENTGESYKDYLRKLKLNHAANLIQHTDLPITQISLESGYSSQSNFNRDFKAFFGTSPSSMREKK